METKFYLVIITLNNAIDISQLYLIVWEYSFLVIENGNQHLKQIIFINIE